MLYLSQKFRIMDKIYGAEIRQDGLYKIGFSLYELIYGFGKDNPTDETGWNWRQRFDHKPTLTEIEETIKITINSETDNKILSGFIWEGMPVWLSSENQFNYKMAYDLAFQSEGASLPVTFKFGTDDKPKYHTFESLSEFNDFYLAMSKHITDTIKAGWDEKEQLHQEISIFEEVK